MPSTNYEPTSELSTGENTRNSHTPRNASSLDHQRRTLLRTISGILDRPMTVLSLVWVALMILEFSGYGNATLQSLGLFIWALFLVQFALEFWIAPNKWIYLRKNWLTTIALLLPAFRLLRAFRALRLLRLARVSRGVGLLRWLNVAEPRNESNQTHSQASRSALRIGIDAVS